MEKIPLFEKKFELKRENIIALTELPVDLSDSKKALGWPVEIQGSGRQIEGTNQFEIRYPLGDIFISFGVVVQELGHLRQEEFNSEIKQIDKKSNWGDYIVAKEEEAFKRGYERLNKYFPEVLQLIEEKFAQHKREGKLKELDSFEKLYNILFGTIKINKAINAVKGLDNNNKDKLEYESLIEGGVPEFFEELEKLKVGEIINKEWIEDVIYKFAQKISEE
jgi:hypothetical protein